MRANFYRDNLKGNGRRLEDDNKQSLKGVGCVGFECNNMDQDISISTSADTEFIK
jgi:hypothetical protein